MNPAERTSWLLRYRAAQMRVSTTRLVIGRSPQCQVVTPSSLVSRRHAAVVLTPEGPVIEDLGSSNGVRVNGQRITGTHLLHSGDEILVGDEPLLIESVAPQGEDERSFDTQVEGSRRPDRFSAPPSSGEATRKGDLLEIMGAVADKALALGRGSEAERILSSPLQMILTQAQAGRPLVDETAARAARRAVSLAAVTGKAEWVDYVFELYSVVGRTIPADLVDDLHGVVRKVPRVKLALMRAYLERLRADVDRMTPAERFVVQRLEGLERLAAAR